MLTIAAGILLAVVAVLLLPVWVYLLIWLTAACMGLAAAIAVAAIINQIMTMVM